MFHLVLSLEVGWSGPGLGAAACGISLSLRPQVRLVLSWPGDRSLF